MNSFRIKGVGRGKLKVVVGDLSLVAISVGFKITFPVAVVADGHIAVCDQIDGQSDRAVIYLEDKFGIGEGRIFSGVLDGEFQGFPCREVVREDLWVEDDEGVRGSVPLGEDDGIEAILGDVAAVFKGDGLGFRGADFFYCEEKLVW